MLIKIRVFPNSKEEQIIKKSEHDFVVKTKTAPKRGEANEKVKKLLACYFNLPLSGVRLLKGFRRRNKIFKIRL